MITPLDYYRDAMTHTFQIQPTGCVFNICCFCEPRFDVAALSLGTFQGQWVGGMRHGYGLRQSVPYGMAAVIRSPLRTSINSLRSGSEHSNGTALLDRTAVPGAPPVPATLTTSASVCSTGSSGSSPAVSRGGFVLTALSESDLLKGKRKGGLFRRSILSGLKLRKSESRSSLASQRSKQSSFRSEAGMSTVSSAASDINSTIRSELEDVQWQYPRSQPQIPIRHQECKIYSSGVQAQSGRVFCPTGRKMLSTKKVGSQVNVSGR